MFFVKDLEKEIHVEPQHFGPELVTTVERQLFQEMEGQQDSQGAWVIAVLSILSVSRGIVAPFLGTAGFKVSYRALLFSPVEGEVLDGVVAEVARIGVFVKVGPLTHGNDIFFISQHQLPSFLAFDHTSTPHCWASHDRSQLIRKDGAVRFRVIRSGGDDARFGTLKGDYLGALDD